VIAKKMIVEPHFDADDNFIHRCRECGEEALFGFGVSLRRGRVGTWYCAKHKPQQQTTSTTNGANSPLLPSSTPDAGHPIGWAVLLIANEK